MKLALCPECGCWRVTVAVMKADPRFASAGTRVFRQHRACPGSGKPVGRAPTAEAKVRTKV